MGFRTLHLVVSGLRRAEQEEKWRFEIDSPTSVLQLTSNNLQKDGVKTHAVFRISPVDTPFCEGIECLSRSGFEISIMRPTVINVRLLKYVAEHHLAPVGAK